MVIQADEVAGIKVRILRDENKRLRREIEILRKFCNTKKADKELKKIGG